MFKEELKLVPHAPGSYQMVNSDGIIIYVGKAKDLNKRLHSFLPIGLKDYFHLQ